MSVDSLHKDYSKNQCDWELVRDVIAGERAIKDGRSKYLPMLSDQEWSEYQGYLFRAPYLEATRRTVQGLTDTLLRRPPQIELGKAENLRPGLETITKDRRPFTSFIGEVVEETLSMGRYGALCDRPVAGTRGPYLVGYKAESIRNWRQIDDGEVIKTDQVILKECVSVPAEFGSEETDQYRVLSLVDNAYYQTIYQPTKGNSKAFTASLPIKPTNRGRPLKDIPFVFFGPQTTTPAVDRSPILGIAWLNLKHYLAAADLAHGRHYTAIPTFWAAGVSEDVNFVAGPNRIWRLGDPEARAGILEFNGHGLKFLENGTADLENQMAFLGAYLFAGLGGTAGQNKDVAEMSVRSQHATLGTICDALEYGLTQLLKVWVEWQDGDPSGVSVKLNREFSATKMEYRDLLQAFRMYQEGGLPRDVFLKILEEGGVLPYGTTGKDVAKQLGQPGQTWIDPNPKPAPTNNPNQ